MGERGYKEQGSAAYIWGRKWEACCQVHMKPAASLVTREIFLLQFMRSVVRTQCGLLVVKKCKVRPGAATALGRTQK